MDRLDDTDQPREEAVKQIGRTNLQTLARMTRLAFVLLAIGIALPTLWVPGASAQQAAETEMLAKELDKSLRAAERDMFNGKNEAADQQLNEIGPQIEQLKAADPTNSRVKSLESKYAKIRKDLDRKLGTTASTATSSAPAASAPPPAGAAPPAAPAAAAALASGPAELPRAIQSDMANTRAKLDEAEAGWAEDSSGGSTVGGSTDPRAVKLEAVEQPLKSASYYYGNILKKCESKSSPCDPAHPDIAALNARIEAMQANVDGLNQELENAAAASAAAAAEEMAQAQAAEADCEAWNERMRVYTEGDKALYRCVSADDADMPGCKNSYDEAVALRAELEKTPWAAEPCGALNSTLSELGRYMDNFKSSYDSYAAEQAAAQANMGEIVFSREPIDPGNPANLTTQFAAGDTIYGLIRTTKPWSEIYGKESNADVMVNVKLDGEKIHAQFVKLKKPELMAQQFLVFEVAPDPGKMTAYSDPGREYGMSTATLRQGPNELTHHLAQLGPGSHTMSFDITYFGTTWSAGSFTIEGDDFPKYAALHEQIAGGVAAAVTLPAAGMTNKSMAAEMESLLENAGWEDIHRINIVDKDWWIDRVSGGDSPVQSRHMAAAALARDADGYYYKVCTFHQDKLLTGGFGELYLSHQGDRVPIPEANIDK
jgi:hypothetical protein